MSINYTQEQVINTIVITKLNLIDELWEHKPNREYGTIFDHANNYAGIDSLKKNTCFY